MTFEPPLPTNIILDRLRANLAALKAAGDQEPHDARIMIAITHLSATIAALELHAVPEPQEQKPVP